MSEKKNARRKGKGEFFAVDRRCWGAVCGLSAEGTYPENIAAAYLVLACFSDGSNTISAASTNAVEKHTGISRKRASLAIKALVDGGAVEALPVEDRVKAGPSVPRYRLRSWSEVRVDLAKRYHADLNDFTTEPAVCPHPCPIGHEHVNRGVFARCAARQTAAAQLVAAGLAVASRVSEKDTNGNLIDRPELWTLEVEPEGDGSPDWVWLPNALVRGARNETPPIERARHTTNVDNLRVLVELYAEHDLAEDAGVSRETWRMPFSRVGPYFLPGSLAAYGYGCARVEASRSARLVRALGSKRFWDAVEWVQRAGLATRVVFVAESANEHAQPLYPFASLDVLRSGAPSYSIKGDEGAQAVRAEMLAALRRIDPDGRHMIALEAAAREASTASKTMTVDHVLLVDASFAAVALVGVLRLRYRPRTGKTSRWFGLEGRSLGAALHELRRIGRTPEEIAALEAEAKGADGSRGNTGKEAAS